MKTRILAGIVLSGALAASAAQAATSPSVEEIYSGLTVAAIQKAHQTAEQQLTARKATCIWREAKNEADSLYAAYPGDEYVEKTYLSPVNQSFVC